MTTVLASVKKELCLAQCAKWQEMLDRAYLSCMRKASQQRFMAVLSSGGIIVLNVIVIGATQLHIPESLVTILVIICCIIKAIQVQFKFEIVAEELDFAKSGLRGAKVSVMELSNEATFLGMVDRGDFKLAKHLVSQALDAVPMRVSLDGVLPETKTKRRWLNALRAGAEKKSKRGTALVDKHLEGTDFETPAAPKPVVVPEGVHAMVPPPDPARRTAEQQAPAPPKPSLAPEAFHGMAPPAGASAAAGDLASAEDLAKTTKMQSAAALSKVHKATLESMVAVLGRADPLLTKILKILGWVVNGLSTLEMTLNLAVVLFANITILQSLEGLVAIFASVNAIQKGIMMKLSLDVYRKGLDMAATRVSSLLILVQETLVELNAGGNLDSDVFDHIKAEYRRLVEKFSSFLK